MGSDVQDETDIPRCCAPCSSETQRHLRFGATLPEMLVIIAALCIGVFVAGEGGQRFGFIGYPLGFLGGIVITIALTFALAFLIHVVSWVPWGHPFRSAQLRLIDVLWFVCIVMGLLLGLSLGGKHFGLWGGVLGCLAGGIVGHVLGALPDRWGTRQMFRKIESSSDGELWDIVNMDWWNLYQSMALLQLAAREDDVSGQLPRVIGMLESDDELKRLFGYDALRLVFDKETELLGEFNPRATAEECRAAVARLKESMDAGKGAKEREGNPDE